MDKYILGLVLTLVIGPIIGFYVHKWRTRADTEAVKDRAPIEVLKAAIDSREREISAARDQLSLFFKDHMREDREERIKDREERDALVEVLTKTAASIQAVNENLTQMRQENRERTAAIHTRLDDIKTEVIRSKNG